MRHACRARGRGRGWRAAGNFKCEVHIPNADSANPNVIIVGPPTQCDQAKTYVLKLVANAQDSASRDRDEWETSGDGW